MDYKFTITFILQNGHKEMFETNNLDGLDTVKQVHESIEENLKNEWLFIAMDDRIVNIKSLDVSLFKVVQNNV